MDADGSDVVGMRLEGCDLFARVVVVDSNLAAISRSASLSNARGPVPAAQAS